MEIKENNFTQDEIELLKAADGGDELYDKSYLLYLCKRLVIDKIGDEPNKGFFKVFTYKDSLRFLIYMVNSPSEKAVDWLANEVNRYVYSADRNTIANIMLRYAQVNGFSNALLERFENYNDLYRYCHYFIKRNDIDINFIIDMKGLERHHYTEDMIDSCIEILEEVFTPFPDPPGSFRQDKERIKMDYLSEHGGAELFFKDGVLIGFCGHNHGHFTEVCVRNEYQGKGYGEVIVRSTLQSVYDLGYNAELYARNDNSRAIHLYEKVGFKKICEAVRVNLIFT
ncbi:MAG: GNAT family N-acetyltransferase [Oscillospiraceae bacterium]|nr:GNAT family N-acetyltransferase [Oscillospiraceae bacterium]